MGKFIETGEDTPKMLEFVEKAFDEMALTVKAGVVIMQDGTAQMGRNAGAD